MKEEEKISGQEAIEDVSVGPVELKGSRKRLKDRYPEENPADEEAWDSLYNRYMDENEAEVGKYKNAEERMSELCSIYPEFAELVYNMLENKMPLRAAVAKVFAQEDLIPEEGDDDYEAYRKAYEERVEGLKTRDSQTKEIEVNEAKSIETIDSFCAEKGLSDEQKEKLIEVINDHFTELLYKRISPEMLEGFLKQMNFDAAVEEAEKVGEIRGKNANIEAKRVKEQQVEAGDGLPNSGGGGKLNVIPKQKAKSFFDLPERKSI